MSYEDVSKSRVLLGLFALLIISFSLAMYDIYSAVQEKEGYRVVRTEKRWNYYTFTFRVEVEGIIKAVEFPMVVSYQDTMCFITYGYTVDDEYIFNQECEEYTAYNPTKLFIETKNLSYKLVDVTVWGDKLRYRKNGLVTFTMYIDTVKNYSELQLTQAIDKLEAKFNNTFKIYLRLTEKEIELLKTAPINSTVKLDMIYRVYIYRDGKIETESYIRDIWYTTPSTNYITARGDG